MAKIMIQGTASSVGKSILVTALCRIFKQDGYKVCPFKSQNMSLNSYITLDGKEMGRAQVLQAYACGLDPEVYMNPILLKPTGDKKCQVIVKGKVFCNTTAQEYHNMKLSFSEMLKKDFEELEKKFDIIVMEGAGSPAEINLRDRDIVNMGMADLVDAPVLLVGDIDKGGVFASLAGTMLLLRDEEKPRVKGTIINKFRGDVEILKPGLNMIEEIIKVPCLGVVPYFKLTLEDEDGAVEFNKRVTASIDIAVLKLPRMSNFTDLDALKIEEDISVRFITRPEEFGHPDLLIIPGSKNTIEDLLYLRSTGIEEKIKAYSNAGTIIGICGGYQMLGKTISDPYGVESTPSSLDGIGLLAIDTVFEKEKVTTRVEARIGDGYSVFNRDKSRDSYTDFIKDEERYRDGYTNLTGTVQGDNLLAFINNLGEIRTYGYEIHMGISTYSKETSPLFSIISNNGETTCYKDGAVNSKGNIFGTYIHGIFDGVEFREAVTNYLRSKKRIPLKKSKPYEKLRDRELDKLADIVRESLDMEKIYELMGLQGCTCNNEKE